MYSRNQYLKVLRGRYLKAITRKEKTQILDEYCYNTGQARKYIMEDTLLMSRKEEPARSILIESWYLIRLHF